VWNAGQPRRFGMRPNGNIRSGRCGGWRGRLGRSGTSARRAGLCRGKSIGSAVASCIVAAASLWTKWSRLSLHCLQLALLHPLRLGELLFQLGGGIDAAGVKSMVHRLVPNKALLMAFEIIRSIAVP
jgi:hypothetical protein